MNPNYGLMVELVPSFQRELFTTLLKMYPRLELATLLSRAPSVLYHYKNCRTRGLSLEVVKKAVRLVRINKEEFCRSVVRIYSAEKERRRCLDLGIESRREYLERRYNTELELGDILCGEHDSLHVSFYAWLNKFGWIEKIKSQSNIVRVVNEPYFKYGCIVLEYETYVKKTKSFRKFMTFTPERIKVDEDFMYFLGFRYGDGTNGARIGIVNKHFSLINYFTSYLRKTFPYTKLQGTIQYTGVMPHTLLTKLRREMADGVDELQVVEMKNRLVKRGYAMTVFFVNAFFNKLYEILVHNLLAFFERLTFLQRGAFLAGFFDADGNVNKLDKNFRWSQTIKPKVEMMRAILKNEGYHVRYDGSSLIIGHKREFWHADLALFKQQVLPFIKHPEKKKEAIELLEGYYVRDCYKELVKIVRDNQGIDNYSIGRIIKRKRSHRELTALTDAGFIKRERKLVDESFKYTVTAKGINWITGSG